jgi:hypothetical protein
MWITILVFTSPSTVAKRHSSSSPQIPPSTQPDCRTVDSCKATCPGFVQCASDHYYYCCADQTHCNAEHTCPGTPGLLGCSCGPPPYALLPPFTLVQFTLLILPSYSSYSSCSSYSSYSSHLPYTTYLIHLTHLTLLRPDCSSLKSCEATCPGFVQCPRYFTLPFYQDASGRLTPLLLSHSVMAHTTAVLTRSIVLASTHVPVHLVFWAVLAHQQRIHR